ncbi:Os04g0389500, partial [Oryza sativa Japonica Group]
TAITPPPPPRSSPAAIARRLLAPPRRPPHESPRLLASPPRPRIPAASSLRAHPPSSRRGSEVVPFRCHPRCPRRRRGRPQPPPEPWSSPEPTSSPVAAGAEFFPIRIGSECTTYLPLWKLLFLDEIDGIPMAIATRREDWQAISSYISC